MIGLLRAYLYVACLWGALGLVPGLRAALGPLLAAIDLLPLLLLARQLLAPRVWNARTITPGTQVWVFALALLAAANVGVSLVNGGSALRTVQYLLALVRPISLFALFPLLAPTITVPDVRREVYRRVRVDVIVIASIQFAVAAVERWNPAVGERFLPVLTESQSARAALAEGDVSGLFPNSVDFSYFVIAAFIVLTLERVLVERRPPRASLVAIFGVFVYFSGSLTSCGCFALYVLGTTAALLRRRQRRWLFGLGALGSVALLVANAGVVVQAVLEKVDDMMLSRLGLIFTSAPLMFRERPGVLVTGLGADFEIIESALRKLPEVPLVFQDSNNSNVINDVFWMGLVLSLGIPLATLYLGTLYGLLKRACQGAVYSLGGALNLAVVIVVAVVLPAGMFNQILLIRSFYSTLGVGLFAFALQHGALDQAATRAVRSPRVTSPSVAAERMS